MNATTGSDGSEWDECIVCGDEPQNGLAVCDSCKEVTPGKGYVLECEWCEALWFSHFKTWNAFRSTLHAWREHRERLREEY